MIGSQFHSQPTRQAMRFQMKIRIYLDLSRLVYAAWSRTPTGIPRVELAYAEYFVANHAEQLSFVVVDAFGRFCLVDKRRATDFISAIARYWRSEISSNRAYYGVIVRALRIHVELLVLRWGLLTRSVRHLRQNEVGFYIISSQLHIEDARVFKRLRQIDRFRLVYFVHDILPVVFPEYFPSDAEARCRRRMQNAARIANLIITNSRDTADAFCARFAQAHPPSSIVTAPLGLNVGDAQPAAAPSHRNPYFLMVGTIEPRKNHLLILNIWRALHADRGDAIPHLLIVGSRGWENENVIDMLDRTPGFRGIVHERGHVSDQELVRLLKGTQALLLPSFAEGFGLPLAEALSLGVPVLCSDIPVFHEVGGSVPEFIDPLDGLGWRKAIEQYESPESQKRNAQLVRLRSWSAPNWQDHFESLMAAMEAVKAPAPRHGV